MNKLLRVIIISVFIGLALILLNDRDFLSNIRILLRATLLGIGIFYTNFAADILIEKHTNITKLSKRLPIYIVSNILFISLFSFVSLNVWFLVRGSHINFFYLYWLELKYFFPVEFKDHLIGNLVGTCIYMFTNYLSYNMALKKVQERLKY